MKIKIAKIPKEGLDLDFLVEKDWLVEELDEKDELRNYIHDSLKCKCHLDMHKDEIFINGEVSLVLKPICFRCDAEYEKGFRTDLNLICLPDRRRKTLRGEDYMDGDVGLNYYTGEELDLSKMAREQLFLILPITFLCMDDCKGLCIRCGSDLNMEMCTCQKSMDNKI